MTKSIRFCLSYDPLNWDFIVYKMNNISIRKRIVDTDVVNAVIARFPFVDWVELLEACQSMSKPNSPQEKSAKKIVRGLLRTIVRLKCQANAIGQGNDETIQTGSFRRKKCQKNVDLTY